MKPFNIFMEPSDELAQIRVNKTGTLKLEYPMHYHSFMELLYCHDGCLNLHLDQKNHLLTADRFALISPMAVHAFSCPESCTCTFIHIPEKIYLQVEHIFSLSSQHTGCILDGTQ